MYLGIFYAAAALWFIVAVIVAATFGNRNSIGAVFFSLGMGAATTVSLFVVQHPNLISEFLAALR